MTMLSLLWSQYYYLRNPSIHLQFCSQHLLKNPMCYQFLLLRGFYRHEMSHRHYFFDIFHYWNSNLCHIFCTMCFEKFDNFLNHYFHLYIQTILGLFLKWLIFHNTSTPYPYHSNHNQLYCIFCFYHISLKRKVSHQHIYHINKFNKDLLLNNLQR